MTPKELAMILRERQPALAAGADANTHGSICAQVAYLDKRIAELEGRAKPKRRAKGTRIAYSETHGCNMAQGDDGKWRPL